jgi:hypothetical protein
MQADPPSPCTNLCRIDPVTRLCEGCKRSLDEIAAWSGLAPEAKRRVLAALELRR